MKVTNPDLVAQAKEAVQECLSNVIQTSNPRPGTTSSYADIILNTRIAGKPWEILVYALKNGQPLYIRNAANLLLRYKKKNVYGIVCAPYISDQGAEICKEEGMGYVDLSGNCCLRFDRVFINKNGSPNRFLVKRNLRTLYSPKAERILRVMLNNPQRSWTVQNLSEDADASIGLASNIKRLLLEREWLEVLEKRIKLKSPEKLLKEWAENYDYRKNEVQSYYSMASINEIEDLIASICDSNGIKYAFTGFSGAARVAPMVRYNRVMFYAGEGFEHHLADCNLKKVESGANVMVFQPYDEGVFMGTQTIGNAKIVSPVQLYLDLAGYKGRGEEAAQAVMEKVLKINAH